MDANGRSDQNSPPDGCATKITKAVTKASTHSIEDPKDLGARPNQPQYKHIQTIYYIYIIHVYIAKSEVQYLLLIEAFSRDLFPIFQGWVYARPNPLSEGPP